jgi:hypothetical protein
MSVKLLPKNTFESPADAEEKQPISITDENIEELYKKMRNLGLLSPVATFRNFHAAFVPPAIKTSKLTAMEELIVSESKSAFEYILNRFMSSKELDKEGLFGKRGLQRPVGYLFSVFASEESLSMVNLCREVNSMDKYSREDILSFLEVVYNGVPARADRTEEEFPFLFKIINILLEAAPSGSPARQILCKKFPSLTEG